CPDAADGRRKRGLRGRIKTDFGLSWRNTACTDRSLSHLVERAPQQTHKGRRSSGFPPPPAALFLSVETLLQFCATAIKIELPKLTVRGGMSMRSRSIALLLLTLLLALSLSGCAPQSGPEE